MNSAPQRGMPQVPFLWTRGVAARETLNYLDRKGVDAEPLLSKAELSRRQLTTRPWRRVGRFAASVPGSCRYPDE